MTENLTVQPERLGVLASHHDNAAVDASSGVEAAAGLGESVAITHGPYCSQFNDTAGVDLAKSLRIAAKIYSEADEAWRKAIGGLFT